MGLKVTVPVARQWRAYAARGGLRCCWLCQPQPSPPGVLERLPRRSQGHRGQASLVSNRSRRVATTGWACNGGGGIIHPWVSLCMHAHVPFSAVSLDPASVVQRRAINCKDHRRDRFNAHHDQVMKSARSRMPKASYALQGIGSSVHQVHTDDG